MRRIIQVLFNLPMEIWLSLICHFPGAVGFRLRYRFWKRRLKFLGKKALIDQGVYFQNPQYISIGDFCWIDKGVIILAGPDNSPRPRRYIANEDFPLEKGMVHIGKFVHLGPYSIISGIGGVYVGDECGLASGVKIFSFSNHYRSDEHPSDRRYPFALFVDHDRQYMIEGAVYLGHNVGVALNTVILPGVSIGRDSFVAINSVVFSSFAENSLLAGNPAKRVKSRYEDDVFADGAK